MAKSERCNLVAALTERRVKEVSLFRVIVQAASFRWKGEKSGGTLGDSSGAVGLVGVVTDECYHVIGILT